MMGAVRAALRLDQNMRFKTIWCSFLLAIASFGTVAQSWIFDYQKLTVADGLSNGFVNCILQDSLGFVWIGTQTGLNRYDGHEIKQWLPDVRITDLELDAGGRIWVSTNRGIYRFDGPSLPITTLPGLRNHSFTGLTLAPGGAMYIIRSDSIFRCAADDQVTPFFGISQLKGSNDYPFLDFKVTGMVALDNDDLWLTIKAGGALQVNASGEVLRHKHRGGWAEQLALHEEGNRLHIVSKQELWECDPTDTSASYHRTASHWVPAAAQDKAHEFIPWMPIRSAGKTTFYNSFYDPGLLIPASENQPAFIWSPEELDFSKVRCSMVDQNNLLWVGTSDGIYRIAARQSPFKQYLSTVAGAQVASSMRAFVEDDAGQIYMASYSGIFKLNPATGRVEKMKKKFTHEGTYWSLARCYDLFFESDTIWCCSESFGLLALELNTDKLQQFMPGRVGWLLLQAMHRQDDGTIWVGGNTGLYTQTPGDDRLVKVHSEDIDFDTIVVYDVLPKDEAALWLGTDKGLLLFSKEQHRLLKRYTIHSGPAPLKVNTILDLYCDAMGMLWMGTKGGGLHQLDPQTDSITYYTMNSHGLPNNNVTSILEENADCLWLGTFNGLVRFEKKTAQVEAFFAADGLTNAEFNNKSAFRSRDGQMYFGGINGVNAFDPDAVMPKDQKPKMLLTRFLRYDPGQGDLTEFTESVQLEREVQLGPSTPFFVVHFGLADFLEPSMHQFAYRIEGLEKEWQQLGQQRMLRLGQLPAGNHRLLIRGRGNSGVWSAPLVLNLTVTESFYKQPLFILGCVLAVLALSFLLFRWRIKRLELVKQRLEATVAERTERIVDQKDRIEKQAEKLKSLDAAKSRFFANVSHELRTPLTLITGNIEQLLDQGQQEETAQALRIAQRNGQRLSSMVEEILDLSKMEAGVVAVQTKAVQIAALLDRLCDTYRSFTGRTTMRISLVQNWTDPSVLHEVDVEKLEKILHNLMSNAVKFTTAEGAVQLIAQNEPADIQTDVITIAVRDTGKGIPPEDIDHVFERFFQTNRVSSPAAGGTGIGLALSQELTQLMGGSLTVESTLGEGSTFTLKLNAKHITPQQNAGLPKKIVLEEHLTAVPESVFQIPEKLHDQVILVVEDHDDMRDFIVRCLPKVWTVLRAADGIEALKVLSKRSVDLVISDIMMPRMDGFQLLDAIRKTPETHTQSVMMLTARAALQDKIQALTIGIDDYLVKPFHPQELRTRLVNILTNRKERQVWLKQPEANDETPAPPTAHEQLAQTARTIILNDLSNVHFGVIDLAEGLTVSQRTLTRKIRSATGLSPLQFIREVRLQEARSMFENRSKETVSEVMYAVGFQAGGHFSKLYQDRFGKMPSKYVE